MKDLLGKIRNFRWRRLASGAYRPEDVCRGGRVRGLWSRRFIGNDLGAAHTWILGCLCSPPCGDVGVKLALRTRRLSNDARNARLVAPGRRHRQKA